MKLFYRVIDGTVAVAQFMEELLEKCSGFIFNTTITVKRVDFTIMIIGARMM